MPSSLVVWMDIVSSFRSAKTLNTIHGAHERNLNYAQLELGASRGAIWRLHSGCSCGACNTVAVVLDKAVGVSSMGHVRVLKRQIDFDHPWGLSVASS